MIFFLKQYKYRIIGVLCLLFSQLGTFPENLLPGAIIIALATPFLIVLFIPLIIEELMIRKKYYLHFITFYLLFFLFIFNKTFQYSSPEKNKHSFSVMSYNVSVFNVYGYLNNNNQEGKELMNWIKNTSQDIYCFQEYYHCETLLKKENPNRLYNTNKNLGRDRGYAVYAPPFLTNHIGATFGLATFSKFPIVSKEKISFSSIGGSTTNGVLITDLKINQDTIRVLNCHLQSIILDNGENNYKHRFERWTQTLVKIYQGSLLREKQIKLLVDLIQKSKYPVLLCGDFNAPVYGYGYFSLRSLLNESFESKGNGFGFTLRDLPYRIDHIFYSNPLKLNAFMTDTSIKASDHYPIISNFSIQKY